MASRKHFDVTAGPGAWRGTGAARCQAGLRSKGLDFANFELTTDFQQSVGSSDWHSLRQARAHTAPRY